MAGSSHRFRPAYRKDMASRRWQRLAPEIGVEQGHWLKPAEEDGELGRALNEHIQQEPAHGDTNVLLVDCVATDRKGNPVLGKVEKTLPDSGADACFVGLPSSKRMNASKKRSLAMYKVPPHTLGTAKKGTKMMVEYAHTLYFRICGTNTVFTGVFYRADIAPFDWIIGASWMRRYDVLTRPAYYALEWPISSSNEEWEGTFCTLEEIFRKRRPERSRKLWDSAVSNKGRLDRFPSRAPL